LETDNRAQDLIFERACDNTSVYKGAVEIDRYGRKTPKQAHGSINLGKFTSSTKLIMDKVSELYDRIVDKDLTVRRMYVVANHVKDESKVKSEPEQIQLMLFDDPEEIERKHAALGDGDVSVLFYLEWSE